MIKSQCNAKKKNSGEQVKTHTFYKDPFRDFFECVCVWGGGGGWMTPAISSKAKSQNSITSYSPISPRLKVNVD